MYTISWCDRFSSPEKYFIKHFSVFLVTAILSAGSKGKHELNMFTKKTIFHFFLFTKKTIFISFSCSSYWTCSLRRRIFFDALPYFFTWYRLAIPTKKRSKTIVVLIIISDLKTGENKHKIPSNPQKLSFLG